MGTISGTISHKLEYYGYRFTVAKPVRDGNSVVRNVREYLHGDYRTRLPCVDLRSFSHSETTGQLSFMFLVPTFDRKPEIINAVIDNMIEDALKGPPPQRKPAPTPAPQPVARRAGDARRPQAKPATPPPAAAPVSNVKRLAGRLQTLKRTSRR